MKVIEREEDAPPKRTLSSATPIQIGMVLGFMGVFGGVVWGAATMNAKLDVVLSKIGLVENVSVGLRKDVDDFKIWKAEIDRSGSKAVDDLKKQLESFKTEFQIHIAQTASKR